VNQQTTNGFPDFRWRYIRQFNRDLFTDYLDQYVPGARITVGYLEDVVGEIKDFKPKKADANGSFRHWYGMIASAIHKQDMAMVQYSVAGMRMAIEFIRKESLWQKQDNRAA